MNDGEPLRSGPHRHAARTMHVPRTAVDLIAGELADTQAAFRLPRDVPESECEERTRQARQRLATVLRDSAEQFATTAAAIAVLAGERRG